MKTGSAGIALIKEVEGFSPTAYRDSEGYSIGYGHFIKANEQYLMQQTITKEGAEVLLQEDLRGAEIVVDSQITKDLNQSQFDALVSLVYNIGSGQFASSTVKGRINTGTFTKEEITEAWLRWNKDNGVVIPGLAKRRQKEVDLYFSDDLKKKS